MAVNTNNLSVRLCNQLINYFRSKKIPYNFDNLAIDTLLLVNLNEFKNQKMVGKKTYLELTELVEKYKDKPIIQQLELSDEQVLKVVKEWYTNGMCSDIFQNEEGLDLEEFLEAELCE